MHGINALSNSLILLLLFCIFSCNKEKIDLQEEFLEGAWAFKKIEDTSNNTILDGQGEPELIFFFLEHNALKGRLKGTYSISENNSVFFQAEIDTLAISGWNDFDELDNFPARYYDFEAIVKDGIMGEVGFYENGWDSQFNIQYKPDRLMWFERY